MKFCSYAILVFLIFTAPAFATVIVSSPTNGETVGSPAHFVANATTTCSRGVASMGVYVNNSLKYVGTGSSMNASVALAPGSYSAVIQEWDNCGGATSTARAINVTGQTGVFVSSPAPNSTVSSSVNFVATAAASSCGQGIAAMGVYVDNRLAYTAQGSKLNTQLSIGAGSHQSVVQAWDYCGGAITQPVTFTVAGSSNNVASSNNEHVLSNIQATGGWNSWAEYAPNYNICSGNCPGVSFSMQQHTSNPSLSGNATRFTIGGSTPYSDVLWSNPIMGQGSTEGMPDSNHTFIPTLHNFIYNADVYVTNAGITQDLEFDVNMYIWGVGMEWGTQCNHLADGDWDIWDNVNAHWVSTGFACKLNNGWNHVTIQVQRESNNTLLYQSITLNGVTENINKYYAPFPVPGGWWGMTVNYQMDGNYNQAWNTTYLDNFSLTYW